MDKKPGQTDYLSLQEKRGAIKAAFAGGMEPAEVFKAVLQNVYGLNERKDLVIEWGKRMGLEAIESLRIAQAANLIPSVRQPRASGQEKLPRKTPGKTGA